MYFAKTPHIIQRLFPNLIWKKKTNKKFIYLTFDDGPIPEATPWVLDILALHNAKATFFCVGENVKKHEDIYNLILAKGHTVGNHTNTHISGWTQNKKSYLSDVKEAASLIDSKLFRPPYGRMSPSQYQSLKKEYKIIMWDVLSGDFDHSLSVQRCYDNVIKNSSDGSIIVFHDSIKSIKLLKQVLPKVMEYFSKSGYQFKKL